jgi:hypothetical protein
MANIAILDDNDIVIDIVVVSNRDIKDESGVEQEELAIAFCEENIGPGNYAMTSYNGNIRGVYPHLGMKLFRDRDVYDWPEEA